MASIKITSNLYQISLGTVNVFVITGDELILIDTGIPGSADNIHRGLAELGRDATEIRHILLTHCHPDHAGSAADLKNITGARTYMHPVDAAMVRAGRGLRPLSPGPGLLTGLLFRLFIRPSPLTLEPCPIDQEIQDGETLPLAGGIRVLHAPGHCAGQVALLWQERVLFAADTAGNILRLGLSLGYEDLDEGRRTLQNLASLDFEIACFGHGNPIREGASQKFRKKWG